MGVRWTACGKTQSRWHWRASWRPCRRSSGGNTCMCKCMYGYVYVCVYMCMHMRVYVYLGSSKPSFPKGQQERKESSLLQKHGARPRPPDTHQDLDEGRKCMTVIGSYPLLCLLCSKRLGSASVSKNVTHPVVLGQDPRA